MDYYVQTPENPVNWPKITNQQQGTCAYGGQKPSKRPELGQQKPRLALRGNRKDKDGNDKAFFNDRQRQCHGCDIKKRCLRNPATTEQVNGRGRQVSFIRKKSNKSPFTE